jgi:hypothetical protein
MQRKTFTGLDNIINGFFNSINDEQQKDEKDNFNKEAVKNFFIENTRR